MIHQTKRPKIIPINNKINFKKFMIFLHNTIHIIQNIQREINLVLIKFKKGFSLMKHRHFSLINSKWSKNPLILINNINISTHRLNLKSIKINNIQHLYLCWKVQISLLKNSKNKVIIKIHSKIFHLQNLNLKQYFPREVKCFS